MRLNCCNENLNKLKTNKCSAEEKMELQDAIEREAANREMSSSEFIRWLYLRWLSLKELIPVEVEKQKVEDLTAADLEMTEEQCNIAIYKTDFYRRNTR